MSLIKPLTELEQDLAAMREDVLVVAEATHHLAVTLRNRNERFWSQPVERILAAMNDDVTSTVHILATNASIATAINASLDALNLDQFSSRAPTLFRSDIQMNESGSFSFIEPVQEDPPAE